MDDQVVIEVDHVSKIFKLPHEKQTSIKSLVLSFYKRNKGYEKQLALDDVSFTIKQGDFFGIVGRNGSGKSTLLKILAGIYTPTQGTSRVAGTLTPFIELGVGFSPELTGRENVFLNGALLGFSRKDMLAMYNDIVEFAELERFMDQKLKNYSSGMQVRLAFSIAIRAQGDILLLDEVLAVGDSAFQQKCYDYFEELKQQKKTVVFVTHDMGAVRRFCNRAIYIQNGKLTEDGSQFDVAEIYIEENMKSALENVPSVSKLHQENNIEILIKDYDMKQKKLTFNIKYRQKTGAKTYVGFSLIKEGITVAELNSLGLESDKEKGELEYSLDTRSLNPGIYEISAALIKLDNKQPIVQTNKRAKFNVEGYDATRGGAFYLENTFKVE